MNNFFDNLKDRERKLLAAATIILLLFIIFILIKGSYDDYKISSNNLTKAKNDYEYVFNKVSKLKTSLNKKAINETNINFIIINNNLADLISDLSIDKTSESFLVMFNANNINSALLLSENIINQANLKINKINYKNNNDSISVILVFNF
jgi:type II secretory pathway component PulM